MSVRRRMAPMITLANVTFGKGFHENYKIGPVCWEWKGIKNKLGYGRFQVRIHGIYRAIGAHRISFMLHRGDIPKGLTLDHLCRNTSCVNPKHLEPISERENILRGTCPAAINKRKTACHKGHPLSGDNLINDSDGKRRCRTCTRNRWLRKEKR